MPGSAACSSTAGARLDVASLIDANCKCKCIVNLYSACTGSVSKALTYSMHCEGTTVLPAHLIGFIRKRNEPYRPLPSQPQLVLIYPPRRDGRLSRLWCEVALAEIRTHNLPIANPALCHTASCAPAQSPSIFPLCTTLH